MHLPIITSTSNVAEVKVMSIKFVIVMTEMWIHLAH